MCYLYTNIYLYFSGVVFLGDVSVPSIIDPSVVFEHQKRIQIKKCYEGDSQGNVGQRKTNNQSYEGSIV